MKRKIIILKTLNKTQEDLKTESRKTQLLINRNELKMKGEERKKRKK